MRLFVSIVVIQIVVIIYSLSFIALDFEFLRKLSILTLLAQLVGLVLLILLCKLRKFFNNFNVVTGVLTLLLLVTFITTVLAQVIGYLDMQLTFYLFKNQSAVNYLNLKLTVSTTLITLAIIRYFYIQDQWQRQIEKLSNARLNALQARIKPHFLFNSLNSISSLITIDADKADQALTDFSSLLRRAFTQKDKTITLEDELKYVNQYLAIEKLRLDERLAYKINFTQEVLSIKVPVLCLQPLVENAIIHGIQPLEEGGKILINLTKGKDYLTMQVINPFIEHTHDKSNGTALINIQERLAIQYGSKAEMKIEPFNGIYTITIKIPL
jgi:two-component system sensor histidine kinase AlgZ